MKINKISSVNFNAKIIDSHCHIGQWNENNALKDYTKDLDVFIKNTLDNGDVVEKVIVSNLDCMSRDNAGKFLSNEIEGNKKLLELVKNNQKIAPLATCQPGYGNVDNIKKLFAENPKAFIGLKFHPEQLGMVADDKAYEPYMKFAKENKNPCLFHSGSTKVSNPKAILNLAKKFPEVDVVIAHWGAEYGGDYDVVTDIIIDSVKKKNAKIYADISWVDCNDSAKPTLNKIIKRLKEANALDRILFGSDAPLGRFGGEGENNVKPMQAYTQMVDDIKNMIKKEYSEKEAEEIIEKIFYKNSETLFFKEKKGKQPIFNSKNKKIVAVGAVLTALSGCIYFLLNKNNKEKNNEKNLSCVV